MITSLTKEETQELYQALQENRIKDKLPFFDLCAKKDPRKVLEIFSSLLTEKGACRLLTTLAIGRNLKTLFFFLEKEGLLSENALLFSVVCDRREFVRALLKAPQEKVTLLRALTYAESSWSVSAGLEIFRSLSQPSDLDAKFLRALKELDLKERLALNSRL